MREYGYIKTPNNEPPSSLHNERLQQPVDQLTPPQPEIDLLKMYGTEIYNDPEQIRKVIHDIKNSPDYHNDKKTSEQNLDYIISALKNRYSSLTGLIYG